MKEKLAPLMEKRQVVMLATEKASSRFNIFKSNADGKLFLSDGGTQWYPKKGHAGGFTSQELYILSDEEIKESCYAYSISTNTVEWLSEMQMRVLRRENWKKIIATTDPLLEMTSVGEEFGKIRHSLPKLPTDFIQAYIKAYNEGKQITSIIVEYEQRYFARQHYKEEWQQCSDAIYHDREKEGVVLPGLLFKSEKHLKLRSDNSIVVHPVKERMFTEKELREYIADFVFEEAQWKGTGWYSDGYTSKLLRDIDAWLSEK